MRVDAATDTALPGCSSGPRPEIRVSYPYGTLEDVNVFLLFERSSRALGARVATWIALVGRVRRVMRSFLGVCVGTTVVIVLGACTPNPPSLSTVELPTPSSSAEAAASGSSSDDTIATEADEAGAPAAAATIAEPDRRGPVEANGVVDYVIDGDTVDVVLDGQTKQIRVRLLGIDTPETKKEGVPVECFGKESTSALRALLAPKTRVRLERDVELLDRYGRTLAYVFRADDGLFVNLEMVRTGFALPLTYPPNVAHVDALTAAGDAARTLRAGLWTRCESGHDPGATDTVALVPSQSSATIAA